MVNFLMVILWSWCEWKLMLWLMSVCYVMITVFFMLGYGRAYVYDYGGSNGLYHVVVMLLFM